MAQKDYEIGLSWATPTPISGNIGINTSTPDKKLVVNGNMNLSGTLYNNYNALAQWLVDGNDMYYTAGNVGIATAAPSCELEIAGDMRATTYDNTSDRRLKHDIATETLGVSYINALKPCTYAYNDSDVRRHGFIAQDVLQTENADCVSADTDGYYALEAANLLAPMVKALQELTQEQAQLENALDHLLASVSA